MRHSQSNRQTRRRRAPAPRNRPKTNWRALLSCFLASVVVSLIGAFALTSPDLRIADIEIAGVHYADSLEIDDMVHRAKGHNILLFFKSPMLRQLAQISEIESVKIGRRLPNTVWIRIRERQPVASFKTQDGYVFVSADGKAFHKSQFSAAKLPVIYAAGCDKIKLMGQQQHCNYEYAMNTLTNVREQKLRCKKIYVDRQGNICLNMISGLLVKLGQPDDLNAKISQLRRTLDYKPSLEREALYVDVSCPSEKVYMPKSASNGVL